MQENFPKELPSAADLDVVAAEQKVREATGKQITPEQRAQLAFYLTDALNKPTPAEVDNIISVYATALQQSKAYDLTEKGAKQALLGLITLYGHPAPGTEHSHIIRGELNHAVMTGSTTKSLLPDRVGHVMVYLQQIEREALFGMLFEERLTHEVREGAEHLLLTADLPKNVRVKLSALFHQCFDIKDSAPRVKFGLLQREPKQPRKRAAKKQTQQQAVQA